MARRPPPPYFMANAILNFHFDYWNLSLMFSQHAENKCGCRPWHVPSEDGAKMCFVLGNVCFNQASSFWCVQDDFLVLLYLYLINSLTCACTGHWRWYFILSGYGEDQGKEDLSNVQLQKWLRGVSSLKASLHFLLKLRFHFFRVSSTTVLDLSWMFRSRYTLTVDNVETHERLSSGFMVSKNNFKVLLSTIFTDEAFFL